MKRFLWITAILVITVGLNQMSNADYDSDFNELFGSGPATSTPTTPAPTSTPKKTVEPSPTRQSLDDWTPQMCDENYESSKDESLPQEEENPKPSISPQENNSKEEVSRFPAKVIMTPKAFATALTKEKDADKRAELMQQAENNEMLKSAKPILEKTLYQKLDVYYQALSKKANVAVNAKTKKANLQQVLALQAKAKDARSKDLSKEELKPIIDEVFETIMANCWIEPSELIEGDAKLQELRNKVLAEGKAWNVMAEKWNTLNADPLTAVHCPTVEEFLELTEFDAILINLPTSKQGKQILAQNRKLSTSIDIEEAMCIAVSNRYRMIFGLEPQLTDVLLCASARDHSRDMLKLNFFSHESPVPGKKSFTDRAKRFRAKDAASENIFYGSEKGEVSAKAWFYSPGHHKNMMNGSTRMGVGRCGNRHTQMTGR